MRKNPYSKILRCEPKEEHLNTIPKSRHFRKFLIPTFMENIKSYIQLRLPLTFPLNFYLLMVAGNNSKSQMLPSWNTKLDNNANQAPWQRHHSTKISMSYQIKEERERESMSQNQDTRNYLLGIASKIRKEYKLQFLLPYKFLVFYQLQEQIFKPNLEHTKNL